MVPLAPPRQMLQKWSNIQICSSYYFKVNKQKPKKNSKIITFDIDEQSPKYWNSNQKLPPECIYFQKVDRCCCFMACVEVKNIHMAYM